MFSHSLKVSKYSKINCTILKIYIFIRFWRYDKMAHVRTNVNNKNACRVCFDVSENSKLLFQHPTIVEKLNFVGGPLQCDGHIEVPQYICIECEGELEFAYKYFIEMKCSNIRNFVITGAGRKEDDAQLVFKVEDSKSDFRSDILIFEDLQTNADRHNDVDEDILTSPVESSSVTELDKYPTLVLDNIDMATDKP